MTSSVNTLGTFRKGLVSCYTDCMQFQVPQFIEVEDKIFGPLTFRQFVYMGGGLGLAYILYRVLPLFIAGPLIVFEVAAAAALAFFEYNGRPFIHAVESAFFYFIRTKLYLWNNNRAQQKSTIKKTVSRTAAEVYVPKLSDSRLHDLAWSLDIQERIAAGTVDSEERVGMRRPLSDLIAPVRTARDAMI